MLSTLSKSKLGCPSPQIEIGDIHPVFFYDDQETFPNGDKCPHCGWYGFDSVNNWMSAIEFDTQDYFIFIHDGHNSGLVWSISHWDVVPFHILDTEGELMSKEESLKEFLRLFVHYTRYFG